jgi:hypothetical protein
MKRSKEESDIKNKKNKQRETDSIVLTLEMSEILQL